MPGLVAGQGLPAANGGIDIAWIKFQCAAAPTSALGGDHRRAAAEKGIKHGVAARRAVEDRTATIATGFTVGCSAKRLPSAPQRAKELAPG